MKLSSDPKPVKFRIVSGGEEHSSLDSLRQNFCISDLKNIENQLKRWLNRQGPEGVEIAEQLNFRELNSPEDYFAVYKLFFQKELKDNKIDNSSQLIKYWHSQKRNSKDIDTLIRLGFGKDDNITVFCYCHKDEFSDLTDDWLATLKNIRIKTDNVNQWIVEESIQKEEDEIKEKIKYIIKYVRVRKLKHDIKNHFQDTEMDWNNYTGYSIDEDKIRSFVIVCKNIRAIPMTYEAARERLFGALCFTNKKEFVNCRKNDFLFDAKLFVLSLVYQYPTQKLPKDEWIKEFPKVMSPKQNEIIQKYDAASAVNWLGLGNLIQRFVLDDLFKFLDLE